MIKLSNIDILHFKRRMRFNIFDNFVRITEYSEILFAIPC